MCTYYISKRSSEINVITICYTIENRSLWQEKFQVSGVYYILRSNTTEVSMLIIGHKSYALKNFKSSKKGKPKTSHSKKIQNPSTHI